MSYERIEGKERKEHGKVDERLGKDYHDKDLEMEGKSEREYGKAEEKVGKMNEKEEQKGRPTTYMGNDAALASNLKKEVTTTTEDEDGEIKEEVITTIH